MRGSKGWLLVGVAVAIAGCGGSGTSAPADVPDLPTASAAPSATRTAGVAAEPSASTEPTATPGPGNAGEPADPDPADSERPSPRPTPDLALGGTWAAWAGATASVVSASHTYGDLGRYVGVSADGRFAVFTAAADQACGPGVVVVDLRIGTCRAAATTEDGQPARSVRSDGTNEPARSDDPAISADGRTVAFVSNATNLVDGIPDDSVSHLFVKNLDTGAVSLASATADGTPIDAPVLAPRLSGDGGTVAFLSSGTTVVPGRDTSRGRDLFVKNLRTGQVVRASVTPTGGQFPKYSNAGEADVSADGARIAFEMFTGGTRRIYVWDRGATGTRLLSTGKARPGRGFGAPSISANGRLVAFAASLRQAEGVRADRDAFVVDLSTGGVRRVSVAGAGVPALPTSVVLSRDGRTLAYGTAKVGEGDVVLVDLASGRRAVLAGADVHLTPDSLSGDGSVLVVGSSRNSSIKSWRRGATR